MLFKAIVFYWDNAAVFEASPKAQKRLLKQWTHTAKAFGVHKLLIVGGSIPRNNDRQITIETFASYAQVRDAYKDLQYVVMTENGEYTLKDVILPVKDSALVMGSNYSEPVVMDNDITIRIDAEIALWDVVAAGIALHGLK